MAANFERFLGRENKAGTLSSVTRHNCSTHHAKLHSLLNAFCTAINPFEQKGDRQSQISSGTLPRDLRAAPPSVGTFFVHSAWEAITSRRKCKQVDLRHTAEL